jgi:predicted adenylyl cyclase CyaB
VARNVEIKAQLADPAAVRRKAAAIASGPAELIAQTDTFFVVPAGRLKIREFSDGSGEMIAYERADRSGPKESVYSIVRCADAQALSATLARALPVRGRVVKRREVFLVGRTRVHLDEVEHLGAFVELEVVLRDDEPADAGEREAHALMEALGISQSALVPDAYVDLLERAAV